MTRLKSIREAYGEALVKVGSENSNIVVLEADVGSSTRSILFGNQYPDRYFNVGIAEGNMAAMAAGFASAGKVPFINTFATFMMLRAGDPINSLIAYSNLNVKMAGAYAGLSDSYDGASHHSISDIAVMRSLPNMIVISVADEVETRKAVKAAACYKGPVYLRLSRAIVPTIYDNNCTFEIGKGIQLTDGDDVTLAATGYMVQKSLQAAEKLKKMGIHARVLDIHTIKPIDRELIVRCARETELIITVEEHNIYGGLGSAVAEVLSNEYPTYMVFIGIKDRFAESGDYETLLEKYGLNVANIIDKTNEGLNKKRKKP